jgi:hypothetical protein
MALNELISSSELAGIRADAAQLFVDACTVERNRTSKDDTTRQVNRATGELVDDPRELVYTGQCSIYPIKSRRDRFDEFGQGLIFTRQYRIVLPHTADTVQIRDVFTATSSDDTQLVGREMEVRDVIVSTILGYRSLTVHDFRE